MFFKSLIVLSLVTVLVAQNYQLICDNTAVDTSTSSVVYTLREGSMYCYRFFDSPQTFSIAETTCANDNAQLLHIASKAENDYINATYSHKGDFWIGLNDITDEGVFVWSDGNQLSIESFQIWVDGVASAHNNDFYDCVKFTPQGWIVHQEFCGNSLLPFACKSLACNSTDGMTCEDIVATSSTISGGVIAVIVVIPVAILVVVIILVFLLIMWKFQNDIFNKYICFCSFGNSKAQVNTLKQEVQRLQTELSQRKLSSSGRFSSFSRQPVSQVSVVQNPPAPVNRSFSTGKIFNNGVAPISQPRPSILSRGNSSVGLLKSSLPPLSPLSEEKKPAAPDDSAEL